MELRPRTTALPRLGTGRHSGLEVVPSARLPATYARRKVLRTPNGRPPAGAICSAAPPRPADPRQLRARPSACSARPDPVRIPAPAAPGRPVPKAPPLPGGDAQGWGGRSEEGPPEQPHRLPRGWPRPSRFAFALESTSPSTRPVWTHPAQVSQKSFHTSSNTDSKTTSLRAAGQVS